MTPGAPTAPLPWRRMADLMIVAALAVNAGRILSAERVYEPQRFRDEKLAGDVRPLWPRTRPDPFPTYSSNDRARWATIRALVEQGTFVVGRRDPEAVENSIRLQLAARNVLEAVVFLEVGYRVRVGSDRGIIFEDGWQSVDKVMHPDTLEFYSTKPPLLSVLVAGEYWLLYHLLGWNVVDQRWLVVRTVLFTINLLPWWLILRLLADLAERFGTTDWGRLYMLAVACFGTMVSPFLLTFSNHLPGTFAVVVALWALARMEGEWSAGWMALAGLACGFAATSELPAAAFAAGMGAYLLWNAPARTLTVFVPAALVPVVALLATNYAQLHTFRMAYSEFGGPWYTYEGSHWRIWPGQIKRGIDWAYLTESRAMYAFHLLVGHHGLFSLTPFTLLSVAGMVAGVRRLASGEGRGLWERLALFGLLMTVVVVGFYLVKSNNYGGWTNGPRWLMWLTPLWLIGLLPIADRLGQSRGGRALALALLLLSAMAMAYQPYNPWRHPWLYDFMEARGWVRY